MTAKTAPRTSEDSLLDAFSLEMTGKDAGMLGEVHEAIPPGTRVNVTFLGNEDSRMRLAAVRAVRGFGFVPVPHIPARRLTSQSMLEESLAALQAEGGSEHAFVIAGDPPVPQGPYEDTVSVIRSGVLERYGVRHVSVAGYPEGHPLIAEDVLWKALADKAALLAERGLADSIITQLGFDAGAVLGWIAKVRERGIVLPVRVGVPGPAGVRRLLNYASRLGVSTSTGIARKYGLSLTNLMATAGPDRFIHELASAYEAGRHGHVGLHFYTFGGLRATSEWISGFRATAPVPVKDRYDHHAGSTGERSPGRARR